MFFKIILQLILFFNFIFKTLANRISNTVSKKKILNAVPDSTYAPLMALNLENLFVFYFFLFWWIFSKIPLRIIASYTSSALHNIFILCSQSVQIKIFPVSKYDYKIILSFWQLAYYTFCYQQESLFDAIISGVY